MTKGKNLFKRDYKISCHILFPINIFIAFYHNVLYHQGKFYKEILVRANFADALAPAGYSVQIDQPYINENNETALSFTFHEGEVGGMFHYSIDDNNVITPAITGSVLVATGVTQITGINVSPLEDSVLQLIFYITDSTGNVTDTVKPTFLSVDDNGGDNTYIPGEAITFIVTMGEAGLKVTADLSVPDNACSPEQELLDEGDFFGCSVAITSDGSTIVVGAYGDDDYGSYSGSVYVFSGTNWGTETKITPTDGTSYDRFGWSTAISSDKSTVVVGVFGPNDSSPGSFYIIPLE